MAASLAGAVFYGQNSVALTTATRLFDAVYEEEKRKREVLVLEYAYWDQAVENLVDQLDEEWSDSTLGWFLADSIQVKSVFVVDENNGYVIGYTDGERTEPSAIETYSGGLTDLIAAARSSEEATAPTIMSGHIASGDRMVFAAAGRLTTYTMDEDISTDHVLIFAWHYDPAYLSSLSETFGFQDLRFSNAPLAYGDASRTVMTMDDNRTFQLVWNPHLPGMAVLPYLLVGKLFLFAVSFGLSYLFVSRFKDLAEQLETDRVRAEQASAQKSDFLASMSHELRTPLNAILGFSEVISKEIHGPLGNTVYKDYADDINNAGNHLLGLISSVLDLSKIEAGQAELEPSAVPLEEFSQSVYRLFQPLMKQRQITIDHQTDCPNLELWTDERALRQIVINLLSNAIKFSHPQGTVHVAILLRDDKGISLRFGDSGVGIRKEEMQTVLQPFGQAKKAANQTNQGTGLGLPIAKKLTEMLGGTLDLESEFGVGTTVTVHLPFALPGHEASPAPLEQAAE